MTRKTCNNNKTHIGFTVDSVCDNVYGYDHSRLRCRKTVAHQRFTRLNSRFLHIDDLYRSDSTITKLFLKINDIALNQTFNNINSSSLYPSTPTGMTRNKMLRRQTSLYEKIEKLKSPASPTNSDSFFQLRSRRHTSYINNFVDSSGDDDSNLTKPIRELRSSSKVVLPVVKAPEQLVWDSGRPKRQIKPKRFSVDERPAVYNKNLNKIEVKKNKFKSTNNDKSRTTNEKLRISIKQYFSDSDDDKFSRTKTKRESELTRLNNEAENFLFPKNKDGGSSAESEDSANEECTKAASVNSSNDFISNGCGKLNKNIRSAQEDESMDSTSSEASLRRKKRRLTQAEAFILDNQEYYKFETPGSRLRYHGSYLPPLIPLATSTATTASRSASSSPFPNKNNGDVLSKPLRPEDLRKKVKRKQNLGRFTFSFEAVPNAESWYQTFHRQDTGKERYTSVCSLSAEPRILLPYELGALAPLNPRLCMYAYQEVSRSFLGDSLSPISRTGVCSTPDSCSRDTTNTKTDDTSTGDDTLSGADFQTDSPFSFQRRKQCRRVGGSSKTPRKSPRQHASTLAILSSFLQHRKRKPKSILPIINEEKEKKADINEISTFFNSCLDDLDQLEEEPDAIDCNVHCKPSAIDSIEEYVDDPVKQKQSSKQVSDRKPVRKKRTNKTGWPSKNKRLTFKKEGSHSSGSIIDSTDSKENKLRIKTEMRTKSDIVKASACDKKNCVNIDLATWENAGRLISGRLRSDFQPIVRVQKLANNVIERRKRISPCRKPKPASPKAQAHRTLRRHKPT